MHQWHHPDRACHAGDHQQQHDIKAERLDAGKLHGQPGRQQTGQDATAIQRQQRKQVEHEHHDVDQYAAGAHLQEEFLADAAQLQQVVQCGPENRLDEVGARTSQCDPQHVAARIAQPVHAHRYRLGVAEQERRVRQQQNARQYHRAEGIDVPERVKTDASEIPGGIVAEPVCDESMRRLVKGDRDHQRQHPDRQRVE